MAQLLFDDIITGLQLIKCPHQPADGAALKTVLGGKGCTKVYSQLVVWLCKEIQDYGGSVESVNMPAGPPEEPMLRVELSTMLKELDCPIPTVSGAESLLDPNNRTAALHYLIHELMGVQLLEAGGTAVRSTVSTETGCFSGHPALRDLALIYSILELPSPGPEDNVLDIFETVVHAMQKILKQKKISKDVLLSDPMLRVSLSPGQWARFEEVCHVLNEEYTIRFKTLLKRLDLTMASFKWGKDNKEKAEVIDKVYNTQRRLMAETSNLSVADVLACRTDVLCVPKTSSGAVRDNTKSKLNKMVIVGKVPDRGGRPLEQRPEPEIPSWLKDKKGGGRGGYSQQSRGGQSRASRGNRYQQQPPQNNHRGNQGHQSGNQGYQSGNQGYQSGNQGYQSGNQGHQSGNQGYQTGNQDYQGSYKRGQQSRGSSWGGYNNRRGGGGIY